MRNSTSTIMNRTYRPKASNLNTFALLSLSLLLFTQCSMPPREAWQYIQTNGLVNFLAASPHHRASPPFRASTLRTSSYNRPSSNWSSLWGSGMPNRIHYSTSSTSPTTHRYFDRTSRNESPRSYSPRPRPRDHEAPRVESTETTPPQPAPEVVKNEPPAPSPATNITPNPNPPAPKPAAELPFGTPVPGRPNMVNSPYAGKTQLVDVSGMGPGQTVKCPYTGKLFKVPAGAQAENKATPKTEAKQETTPAPPSKNNPKVP